MVFGLASILWVIMTVLPLAVHDEDRAFLQQIDRAMVLDDFAGAQRHLEQRMAAGHDGTEYALRLGGDKRLSFFASPRMTGGPVNGYAF